MVCCVPGVSSCHPLHFSKGLDGHKSENIGNFAARFPVITSDHLVAHCKPAPQAHQAVLPDMLLQGRTATQAHRKKGSLYHQYGQEERLQKEKKPFQCIF